MPINFVILKDEFNKRLVSTIRVLVAVVHEMKPLEINSSETKSEVNVFKISTHLQTRSLNVKNYSHLGINLKQCLPHWNFYLTVKTSPERVRLRQKKQQNLETALAKLGKTQTHKYHKYFTFGANIPQCFTIIPYMELLALEVQQKRRAHIFSFQDETMNK